MPQQPVGQQDQMIDLSSFVDESSSQVLNADAATNLRSVLGASPGVLRSDADIDPELLIVVNFREPVKLRGLRLLASESRLEGDAAESASGPATLKLFLSRPHYSFQDCASEKPTETVQLSAAQIAEGQEVRLKYVLFQNVSSLTIFVEKNQKDSEVTFLNQLQFIGAPLAATNMKELKKIEHEH
jgi:hypothetical protein